MTYFKIMKSTILKLFRIQELVLVKVQMNDFQVNESSNHNEYRGRKPIINEIYD